MSNPVLNKFICPYCQCTIKSAVISKGCFHRYCYSCAAEAMSLKNNVKACPTCRKPFKSKRDMDRDEQFDAILKIAGT